MQDPMLMNDHNPELGPQAPTFEQGVSLSFMESSAEVARGIGQDLSSTLRSAVEPLVSGVESIRLPGKKMTALGATVVALSAGLIAKEGISSAQDGSQSANKVLVGNKPVATAATASQISKLDKKCKPRGAHIPIDAATNHHRKNKYANVWVAPGSKKGDSTKMMWKNGKGFTFCGAVVINLEHKGYTVTKPTLVTKSSRYKGGSYVDPYPNTDPGSIYRYILFMKSSKHK